MSAYFQINNFHTFFLILAVTVTIISCLFGVESSQIIKNNVQNKKVKMRIFLSIILGFCFLFSHIFISASVVIDRPTGNLIAYFSIYYVFCTIGSYIALGMSQKEKMTIKNYIFSSLILAVVMFSTLSFGLGYLFHNSLEIKSLPLIAAGLLTIGITLSLMRFLIQLADKKNDQITVIWKYIGGMIAGLAMSGIPYVILVSILDFTYQGMPEHSFLFPFILVISINIFLALVPDLLVHERLAVNNRRLEENIEQFRSLFYHNPEAVFHTDLQGYIVGVNKAALTLVGYVEAEIVGMHFSLFVNRGDIDVFKKSFNNAVIGDQETFEIKIRKKNGSLAHVGITSVRIIVKDKIIGVYGIVKDLTEERKAQETINYLAYHDELTTLPNRRLYTMRLHKLKQQNTPFTIMNIDFDRFKRLNDLFGHAFGDCVLIEIAARLKDLLGNEYFIARMGGDEFNVILPDLTDKSIVNRIATSIIEEFRRPHKVREHECLLTASIGVAFFPEHSRDIDSLLKFADIAMYHVKENGSNDFQIYDSYMNDKTIEKINMENDLRYALENNLLEVYYQPKFNSGSNELIGSEALLRWNHEKMGFIPPVTFIKVAEETGLIVALEKWVLRQVCYQIRKWKLEGQHKGRVSINISHVHFYQGDIVTTISSILDETGINSAYLEIEITETAMMNNEFETNRMLQQLRDIGIEISMDDFGTGYSSLGYLHRLSIDRLKIDKSFIQEMQKNEAIVSTIISMAHHLHLHVIAEGVENIEQIQVLEKLGCHEIQGYFYGRPVDPETFTQLFLQPFARHT